MRRVRIVVLDGHVMNPGDLTWEGLQGLGDCEIHERTWLEDVLERAAGADAVLTNKTVITRQTITSLAGLRYIGVLATGYNVVDLEAARDRGIPVTNVPGYSTPSVVQMTFALILELTHRVGQHADGVRQGRWCQCQDFSYWEHPLVELRGLKLGIIGYGSIGRGVAAVGRALGMEILVYPGPRRPVDCAENWVDVDALFRQADIVTLHCPLTSETRALVNAERLNTMKPTAFLINAGRGPLVVEKDLADALNTGRIAGAGLDVLAQEPPSPENPLLKARNCFITPHQAWATRAARIRLMETVVDNLRCFLEGHPKNVVNGVGLGG
jgi:glycerate dehydrogenase